MQIVVVDDQIPLLKRTQALIEANFDDCEVLPCNRPDKALEMIAGNSVGVILLDIVMPMIDGVELLRQIRSRAEYNEIQVIMLTGKSDQVSFKKCFELGADDFINKANMGTEFIARMRSAIRTRKNVEELRKLHREMTEQFNALQEVTRKLQEAQISLFQKEKMASVGQLAAGVAHELNTPLGFVISNFTMLQRYVLLMTEVMEPLRDMSRRALSEGSPALQAAARHIVALESEKKLERVLEDLEPIFQETKDGLSSADNIVKSLRLFTCVDQQDGVGEYDLNQAVENSLIFTNHALKNAAAVEKNLGNIPLINADSGMINQVIVSVLLNAAFAVREVEPERIGLIRVTTFADEEFVYCSIEDNGAGIPAENTKDIFTPFFTTKPVGQGIGLGLSVSYDAVVNKHGGELLFASEVNVGATFTVKLPIRGKNIENGNEACRSRS